MSRPRNKKNADDGCSGVVVLLCGQRRKMILEMQTKEDESKNHLLRRSHFIEKILDKEAEEYFKNKKQP